jgi:hypothetical protein
MNTSHKQALELLKGVMCDPEGNIVSLSGTPEDLAVAQGALEVLSVDPTRQFLLDLFSGLRLREESYVGDSTIGRPGTYIKNLQECMIEACGGDEARGYVLSLCADWTNDLVDIARHYGLKVKDFYRVTEIEPVPLTTIFSAGEFTNPDIGN